LAAPRDKRPFHLKLLRELDDAGRVPGMVVETLDEVLAYIKGLEHEAYLEQ